MRAGYFLLFFIVAFGIVFVEAIRAEEDLEVNLERIVVTNKRTEASLSEATEDMIVVSERDIASLPARDLSEALDYILGIDIETRGGFGRTTSISIQGSDSRQVRVMIDGIPLNSQSSGQVDLTKFPIENIKRIEIIKGASSSTWGSSLGGVVNVITKDTGDTVIPKGDFTVSLAEFRTRKESLEVYGGKGEFGYYQLLSFMESGDEDVRDDVSEKKTFSKLSYDLKDKGKLTASFGYSGADVNSGEYPDRSWESRPFRARYGKLGWEGSFDNIDLEIDLKHSRQDITTHTYNSVTDSDPSSSVWYKDLLYQLSLVSATRLREEDILVIGADFDWDEIKSGHLVEKKSLNLQAPYINYTFKEEKWGLNAGARYDRNSEYGDEVSPSLGVVYRLEDMADTSVRADVSRAFNAPPLLWKYYERVVLGLTGDNPGIGPETAWVYGLGVESRPISNLWVKLSLYRAEVSDAIGNAQNESGEWIKKNFEKFRRQGVALESRLMLSEEFTISGGGAFNDIEDRATGETVQGDGKARQSFNLGMDYKDKNGFKVSLKGYYDYWNEPASSEPNDRKMIFDLRIAREFKGFSVFMNIYNLTNSKCWRDIWFPIPERYFEAGFSYAW